MKPGDRVTLPDGRTGIVWRAQDGYVWVSIDGVHFVTEHWQAVDVVLRDESRQMALPLEWSAECHGVTRRLSPGCSWRWWYGPWR